jgi:hypothetical protein
VNDPSSPAALAPELRHALDSLRAYVEEQDFAGHDPYDVLLSGWGLQRLGRRAGYAITQLHKRNPVNVRALLRIPRHRVPKGIALFLRAYAGMYALRPDPRILATMDELVRWLLENRTRGHAGYCWGLPFPYAWSGSFMPAGSPSVVVTAFVHAALCRYHEATGRDDVLPVLEGCCEFVLTELHRTETAEGLCFSYTTQNPDLCLNANALGAEVLARTAHYAGRPELLELAARCMEFTAAHQREDGSWPYSIAAGGRTKEQIDFHQGFVLDSVDEYLAYGGPDPDGRFAAALRRGAAYYRREQFLDSGRSVWRVPRLWPVDIHNQAQGVITFARLQRLDPGYLPFARTVAAWTVANMRDARTGAFYYRRGRLHVNRIPYIRWAQAWMMNALVELWRAEAGLDAAPGRPAARSTAA